MDEDVGYVYMCIYIFLCISISIYNGMLLSHKKDELLPFGTMWMNLEGIMLSEVSLPPESFMRTERVFPGASRSDIYN